MPPKFEIFTDRIEITSAGSLSEGLSRSEFFDGYSIPRNKELMRVYKDLEMVEQLGTGVMRITAYYGHRCFRFSENFTRMIFPAAEATGENIQHALGKGLGKELGKELSATQIKILHLINSNPKISAREVAQNIGISITAIENNIRKLREAKILERAGGRKEGYWKIIS
ncbi:ATP-binding protein [Arachidicoccus sp.]|uniref:ATP-binding protein n=1 Tax=Arachidicoccus sp. TaxID=1872624 RepID=UPI003D24662F